MSALTWIVLGGVAMTALSTVGGLALLLGDQAQKRLLRPLVAVAAGTLLGGALFHMLPSAVRRSPGLAPFVWAMAGFAAFLALEQLLHWHHCHRATAECRHPMTWLILLGDGLHNLVGGLAVGGTFVADVDLGITTWLAAAAHEVPQELGDYAVLVHGGFGKGRALAYNALSGGLFLVGGLLAYWASEHVDVSFLVPFAAGNFIYIGAADLVPEVNKHEDASSNVVYFLAFVAGAACLLLVASLIE